MQEYEIPRHVTSDESDNITDLLVERVKKTPNLALYATQNDAGEWMPISALEFENQVKALAKGLISAGTVSYTHLTLPTK
jgi:long-chain acyl-CoA synthetase